MYSSSNHKKNTENKDEKIATISKIEDSKDMVNVDLDKNGYNPKDNCATTEDADHNLIYRNRFLSVLLYFFSVLLLIGLAFIFFNYLMEAQNILSASSSNPTSRARNNFLDKYTVDTCDKDKYCCRLLMNGVLVKTFKQCSLEKVLNEILTTESKNKHRSKRQLEDSPDIEDNPTLVSEVAQMIGQPLENMVDGTVDFLDAVGQDYEQPHLEYEGYFDNIPHQIQHQYPQNFYLDQENSNDNYYHNQENYNRRFHPESFYQQEVPSHQNYALDNQNLPNQAPYYSPEKYPETDAPHTSEIHRKSESQVEAIDKNSDIQQSFHPASDPFFTTVISSPMLKIVTKRIDHPTTIRPSVNSGNSQTEIIKPLEESDTDHSMILKEQDLKSGSPPVLKSNDRMRDSKESENQNSLVSKPRSDQHYDMPHSEDVPASTLRSEVPEKPGTISAKLEFRPSESTTITHSGRPMMTRYGYKQPSELPNQEDVTSSTMRSVAPEKGNSRATTIPDTALLMTPRIDTKNPSELSNQEVASASIVGSEHPENPSESSDKPKLRPKGRKSTTSLPMIAGLVSKQNLEVQNQEVEEPSSAGSSEIFEGQSEFSERLAVKPSGNITTPQPGIPFIPRLGSEQTSEIPNQEDVLASSVSSEVPENQSESSEKPKLRPSKGRKSTTGLPMIAGLVSRQNPELPSREVEEPASAGDSGVFEDQSEFSERLAVKPSGNITTPQPGIPFIPRLGSEPTSEIPNQEDVLACSVSSEVPENQSESPEKPKLRPSKRRESTTGLPMIAGIVSRQNLELPDQEVEEPASAGSSGVFEDQSEFSERLAVKPSGNVTTPQPGIPFIPRLGSEQPSEIPYQENVLASSVTSEVPENQSESSEEPKLGPSKGRKSTTGLPMIAGIVSRENPQLPSQEVEEPASAGDSGVFEDQSEFSERLAVKPSGNITTPQPGIPFIPRLGSEQTSETPNQEDVLASSVSSEVPENQSGSSEKPKLGPSTGRKSTTGLPMIAGIVSRQNPELPSQEVEEPASASDSGAFEDQSEFSERLAVKPSGNITTPQPGIPFIPRLGSEQTSETPNQEDVLASSVSSEVPENQSESSEKPKLRPSKGRKSTTGLPMIAGIVSRQNLELPDQEVEEPASAGSSGVFEDHSEFSERLAVKPSGNITTPQPGIPFIPRLGSEQTSEIPNQEDVLASSVSSEFPEKRSESSEKPKLGPSKGRKSTTGLPMIAGIVSRQNPELPSQEVEEPASAGDSGVFEDQRKFSERLAVKPSGNITTPQPGIPFIPRLGSEQTSEIPNQEDVLASSISSEVPENQSESSERPKLRPSKGRKSTTGLPMIAGIVSRQNLELPDQEVEEPASAGSSGVFEDQSEFSERLAVKPSGNITTPQPSIPFIPRLGSEQPSEIPYQENVLASSVTSEVPESQSESSEEPKLGPSKGRKSTTGLPVIAGIVSRQNPQLPSQEVEEPASAGDSGVSEDQSEFSDRLAVKPSGNITTPQPGIPFIPRLGSEQTSETPNQEDVLASSVSSEVPENQSGSSEKPKLGPSTGRKSTTGLPMIAGIVSRQNPELPSQEVEEPASAGSSGVFEDHSEFSERLAVKPSGNITTPQPGIPFIPRLGSEQPSEIPYQENVLASSVTSEVPENQSESSEEPQLGPSKGRKSTTGLPMIAGIISRHNPQLPSQEVEEPASAGDSGVFEDQSEFSERLAVKPSGNITTPQPGIPFIPRLGSEQTSEIPNQEDVLASSVSSEVLENQSESSEKPKLRPSKGRKSTTGLPMIAGIVSRQNLELPDQEVEEPASAGSSGVLEDHSEFSERLAVKPSGNITTPQPGIPFIPRLGSEQTSEIPNQEDVLASSVSSEFPEKQSESSEKPKLGPSKGRKSTTGLPMIVGIVSRQNLELPDQEVEEPASAGSSGVFEDQSEFSERLAVKPSGNITTPQPGIPFIPRLGSEQPSEIPYQENVLASSVTSEVPENQSESSEEPKLGPSKGRKSTTGLPMIAGIVSRQNPQLPSQEVEEPASAGDSGVFEDQSEFSERLAVKTSGNITTPQPGIPFIPRLGSEQTSEIPNQEDVLASSVSSGVPENQSESSEKPKLRPSKGRKSTTGLPMIAGLVSRQNPELPSQEVEEPASVGSSGVFEDQSEFSERLAVKPSENITTPQPGIPFIPRLGSEQPSEIPYQEDVLASRVSSEVPENRSESSEKPELGPSKSRKSTTGLPMIAGIVSRQNLEVQNQEVEEPSSAGIPEFSEDQSEFSERLAVKPSGNITTPQPGIPFIPRLGSEQTSEIPNQEDVLAFSVTSEVLENQSEFPEKLKLRPSKGRKSTTGLPMIAGIVSRQNLEVQNQEVEESSSAGIPEVFEDQSEFSERLAVEPSGNITTPQPGIPFIPRLGSEQTSEIPNQDDVPTALWPEVFGSQNQAAQKFVINTIVHSTDTPPVKSHSTKSPLRTENRYTFSPKSNRDQPSKLSGQQDVQASTVLTEVQEELNEFPAKLDLDPLEPTIARNSSEPARGAQHNESHTTSIPFVATERNNNEPGPGRSSQFESSAVSHAVDATEGNQESERQSDSPLRLQLDPLASIATILPTDVPGTTKTLDSHSTEMLELGQSESTTIDITNDVLITLKEPEPEMISQENNPTSTMRPMIPEGKSRSQSDLELDQFTYTENVRDTSVHQSSTQIPDQDQNNLRTSENVSRAPLTTKTCTTNCEVKGVKTHISRAENCTHSDCTNRTNSPLRPRPPIVHRNCSGDNCEIKTQLRTEEDFTSQRRDFGASQDEEGELDTQHQDTPLREVSDDSVSTSVDLGQLNPKPAIDQLPTQISDGDQTHIKTSENVSRAPLISKTCTTNCEVKGVKSHISRAENCTHSDCPNRTNSPLRPRPPIVHRNCTADNCEIKTQLRESDDITEDSVLIKEDSRTSQIEEEGFVIENEGNPLTVVPEASSSASADFNQSTGNTPVGQSLPQTLDEDQPRAETAKNDNDDIPLRTLLDAFASASDALKQTSRNSSASQQIPQIPDQGEPSPRTSENVSRAPLTSKTCTTNCEVKGIKTYISRAENCTHSDCPNRTNSPLRPRPPNVHRNCTGNNCEIRTQLRTGEDSIQTDLPEIDNSGTGDSDVFGDPHQSKPDALEDQSTSQNMDENQPGTGVTTIENEDMPLVTLGEKNPNNSLDQQPSQIPDEDQADLRTPENVSKAPLASKTCTSNCGVKGIKTHISRAENCTHSDCPDHSNSPLRPRPPVVHRNCSGDNCEIKSQLRAEEDLTQDSLPQTDDSRVSQSGASDFDLKHKADSITVDLQSSQNRMINSQNPCVLVSPYAGYPGSAFRASVDSGRMLPFWPPTSFAAPQHPQVYAMNPPMYPYVPQQFHNFQPSPPQMFGPYFQQFPQMTPPQPVVAPKNPIQAFGPAGDFYVCNPVSPPINGFNNMPGVEVRQTTTTVNGSNLQEMLEDATLALRNDDNRTREAINCPSGEQSCRDGSKCIALRHVCDNEANCLDGSDEMFCTCKDRIEKVRLCDGYFDCPNGEDEQGCFGCKEFEFSCDNWSKFRPGTCTSIEHRCDGVQQCEVTGKDEMDCTILTDHVGQHSFNKISNAVGFLHRNYKGVWYPTCSNTDMWALEVCTVESGPHEISPKSHLVASTDSYQGPFLSMMPTNVVKFSDTCYQNTATFVQCPPLYCGLRITQKNPYRTNEVDTSMEDILTNLARSSESAADDPITGISRVVGGRACQPAAWPWLVSIYRNGIFHCGGVLINDQWVLTAAHCVDKYWFFYYEIQAGMLRRFSYSPMEQTRWASVAIPHAGYNKRTLRDDIALMKLSSPVRFNRYVRPICLPSEANGGRDFMMGPAPGTVCTAVGWGATIEHGTDPDHMREVEIPILPDCKHLEDQRGDEICAGLLEGGRDACQGDSGGPLMCRNVNNPNQWYLAGIVSHGEGCARPNEPGVYTKVARYLGWVAENMRDSNFIERKPVQTCPGYSCKGTLKCLPKKRRCDKIVDCLLGDDEFDCWSSSRPSIFSRTGPVLQQKSPIGELLDNMFDVSGDESLGNSTDITTTTAIQETPVESPQITTDKTESRDSTESINMTSDTRAWSSTTERMQMMPSDFFKCKILLQLIPKVKHCDRILDCEDGTDESSCTCADYLKRNHSEVICDGVTDCKDLSDELGCDKCTPDQYFCRLSQQCVPKESRCDGKTHCLYNEDEWDCVTLTDGQTLTLDSDLRPSQRTKGVITINRSGVWRPLCNNYTITSTRESAAADGPITSRRAASIATNACNLLGLGEYTAFHRLTVSDSPIRAVIVEGAQKISGEDDSQTRTGSLAPQNKTCSGLVIGCSDGSLMEPPHMRQFHESMINEDAELYTAPWNAIVYANGQYRCTGTILNSNWILTAAECAEGVGLTENYFAILVGKGKARLEMEGPHEQSIKITKWQQINGTNIVILGTNEPIKFSRYVRAAPLVRRTSSSKETCLAIGIDDGRAVFEQLESQENCATGSKCFHQIKQKLVCRENLLWSGTITCRSRDGWYAAAIFENVTCNFDTGNRTYTSLNHFKVQIEDAMMSPNIIEHWPVCTNGFRCILGQCIENSKVCNGIPDCRSAEDENTDFCDRQENQCHLTDSCVCRTTEMRCTNGKCVLKSQFCDRNNDCGDFSDEPPVCSCMAYLNLTHPERICDGTLNCYDRTDESPSLCDCGPGRFRCGSTDFCVAEQTLCDGVPDCPNSEDESRCLSLKTSHTNSNSGEVMVRTSGIWHTGCFKPNHTTTELEEICEKLGFGGGSARKLTPPVTTTPAEKQDLTPFEIREGHRYLLPVGKPVTDHFGMVWIRRAKGNGNRFKVRMRTGFEPYVTFVEDEECHRLFLECL